MTYSGISVIASQSGVNSVSISGQYGVIVIPAVEARKLGEWLCRVEVPAPEKPTRGEITLEEARATDKGLR